MTRAALFVPLVVWVYPSVAIAEEPHEFLDRFLARIRTDLSRLTDHVCSQTVERFVRGTVNGAWRQVDTLRLEVAIAGDQELYGKPGDREFHTKPLAEVIGRGTISTGRFGLMARHVFLPSATKFSYQGEGEENTRKAQLFDYDVAPIHSTYVLRAGNAESTVGFQGTFWVDPATMDLLRLDVQAYDIPDPLGLSEAKTSILFQRVPIDQREVLLPASAAVTLVAGDGAESLNRIRYSDCRRYQVESSITFEDPQVTAAAASADRIAPTGPTTFPDGSVIELTLDSPLDPARAAIGDTVRAALSKALKSGDQVLIPEGSHVICQVVRLEKGDMPFPLYEVGLELVSVETGGRVVPLSATMLDAGPAAGLLRQARRLDPKFTRRRSARMDILVKEVQRGQGILHWDARRVPLPQGLRMKWLLQPLNAGR